MTIRCHFDGKVFVPDEPVDLPVNQTAEVSLVTAMPEAPHQPVDWSYWIGIGNRYPKNSNPRFKSDDDLWEKD